MLLDLPEKATMEEIKSNYRDLIRKWHPDSCEESKKKCTEMTARLTAAYSIINEYCKHYKFSFSRKEVKNYLSDEEWWLDRFGPNTLWEKEEQSE